MSVFQLYSRNGIRYANVKTDLGKRKRVSLQTTKKKEALKRAIFLQGWWRMGRVAGGDFLGLCPGLVDQGQMSVCPGVPL